jgi:hypothetical protein
MKKLMLTLSLIATMPTFSAIPSQDPASNAQELTALRAENAKLKSDQAADQAKKEHDAEVFKKHKEAMISNGTMIAAGAVIGFVGTLFILEKCIPRFTK